MEENQTKNQIEKQIEKQGTIVTDALIRVATIERMLIKKNLVTEKELQDELIKVSDEIIELVRKQLEKNEG